MTRELYFKDCGAWADSILQPKVEHTKQRNTRTLLERLFQQRRQTPAAFLNLTLHYIRGPEGVELVARFVFLFRLSALDVMRAGSDINVLEGETRVCFARERQNVVRHLFRPRLGSPAQLPVRRLLRRQTFRHRRICRLPERVVDSLSVPIAMKLSGGLQLAINKRPQRQLTAALIGEFLVVVRGLEDITVRVEILCADVQRLMNVAEVMCEHYH